MKHTFYKHTDNKTVAVQVLSSFYVKEKDRWSVRVMWWNWSPKFGLRFSMGITQRFNVTREQKTGWKVLDTGR
jgi:hypothetical protein